MLLQIAVGLLILANPLLWRAISWYVETFPVFEAVHFAIAEIGSFLWALTLLIKKRESKAKSKSKKKRA